MNTKGSRTIQRTKMMMAMSAMPPLSHWPDRSVEFDWRKSDVLKWLCQQPDVLAYIFNKANSSGMIEFDEDKKLWTGIDFTKPVAL